MVYNDLSSMHLAAESPNDRQRWKEEDSSPNAKRKVTRRLVLEERPTIVLLLLLARRTLDGSAGAASFADRKNGPK